MLPANYYVMCTTLTVVLAFAVATPSASSASDRHAPRPNIRGVVSANLVQSNGSSAAVHQSHFATLIAVPSNGSSATFNRSDVAMVTATGKAVSRNTSAVLTSPPNSSHALLAADSNTSTKRSNVSELEGAAKKAHVNSSSHEMFKVEVVVQKDHANQSSIESNPLQNSSEKANSSKSPTQQSVPNFLKTVGETNKCECEFNAMCSCEASISFLDCVSEACASGECECDTTQYKGACLQLASQCMELTLECSEEKTVCMSAESHSNISSDAEPPKAPVLPSASASVDISYDIPSHAGASATATGTSQATGSTEVSVTVKKGSDKNNDNIVKDVMPIAEHKPCEKANIEHMKYDLKLKTIMHQLMALKEQKCRLELAHQDGWVNADNQLAQVNPMIEARFHQLVMMGSKLPEMHCEKDFEEWTDPPTIAPGISPDKPPESGAASLVGASTAGIFLTLFAVGVVHY